MAFHNTNYQMVPLSTGTYETGDLGNGITASTVHEIYCLTPGSITITALGGGTVTASMTAGQSIKVLAGKIVVSSGTYTGFKAMFQASGIGPIKF